MIKEMIKFYNVLIFFWLILIFWYLNKINFKVFLIRSVCFVIFLNVYFVYVLKIVGFVLVRMEKKFKFIVFL